MESYCQWVVSEVLQVENSYLEIGNLFEGIREIMSRFLSCSIQFGNIMCNVVAYKLAKNVWHVNHIIIWFGEMPDFITQTIWFDKQALESFEHEIGIFIKKRKRMADRILHTKSS